MRIAGYWLASGILGVTASTLRRAFQSGADIVVTKSIGLNPRLGHLGPVLTSTPAGILNAVGLTNPGINAFKEELTHLRKWKIPFVLSIFGTTVEEITEVAQKGIETQPQALELNLSCPHAEIGQIAQDPNLTYKFVHAVKDVADCPVFAKLTPNVNDIVAVGRAAERAGADAVVAINTVRGMRIDITLKRPTLGNKVGGLSGPAIFPITVRCVFELYNALSIPIIGVGGVTTWRDAIELHLAGASAIQIGSALLNGFDVFQEIKRGVKDYLRQEGYSDISQIVGAAGRL